jgi:hypothetical protein
MQSYKLILMTTDIFNLMESYCLLAEFQSGALYISRIIDYQGRRML